MKFSYGYQNGQNNIRYEVNEQHIISKKTIQSLPNKENLTYFFYKTKEDNDDFETIYLCNLDQLKERINKLIEKNDNKLSENFYTKPLEILLEYIEKDN
jgi:hypothetical protein